jgi:diamine N-acetyltransferase
VTLRAITPGNRAAVEALTVDDEQRQYVADVTQSLRDAVDEPEGKAWYRAVYSGDEPVGFVMISDGTDPADPRVLGPYYLWRLLIDRHHQGRGYGAAALDRVVAHLMTRPDAYVLLTSVVPGPHTPKPFYLRYGFVDTGTDHDGERVLELDLAPWREGRRG